MLKSFWENTVVKGRQDLLTALKANVLFQDLSNRDLRFVADIVHLREYRNGEIVFHQDEIGFGMYIIAHGVIDITASSHYSDAGGEMFVVRLEQGDFFGELALVEENGRRSANAKAATDTRLIGFFKPDLLDIIARRPAAGVKILLRLSEVLGRRMAETTGKMTQLNEEIQRLKGGFNP